MRWDAKAPQDENLYLLFMHKHRRHCITKKSERARWIDIVYVFAFRYTLQFGGEEYVMSSALFMHIGGVSNADIK